MVGANLKTRLVQRYNFWKERDEIIDDMQQGHYTASQTAQRLSSHGKPGGRERAHVWSCRNGHGPCRCPFAFDQPMLVPLVGG